MNHFLRNMLLILVVGLAGCQLEEPVSEASFQWDLPQGVLPPPVPEDNQMTVARIELGRELFYDPVLSVDTSINCATCHQPVNGLANPQPVMRGVFGRLGFRNTPTLTQVAYSPYFFVEGGSPTLEMQVLGPIENHDEFGFNAAELYERFKTHDRYNQLAIKAYGRPMDLWVLTRSIAAFERTMVSSHSPFDDYFYRGDSTAMTPQQIRGWELFASDRTNCSSCHSGFPFSTYEFENIGLYEEYKDLGLARRTILDKDVGKVKVPTLRNVARTAPYMHDGSIRTLIGAVKHFNDGGVGHPNQSELIRPLKLSQDEIADLVAFLHALTDTALLSSNRLQAPK